MPLQIVNVENISPERKAEIVGYLQEKFTHVVKARSTQIDQDYKRWIDNYAAKPLEKVRTTPFYRASNFVPRLIGTLTDIMSARLIGIVWAPKPIWKPRSLLGGLPHEYLEEMATWLEFVTHYELQLFDPLDMGIFRVCKTGTTIWKSPWESRVVQLVSGVSETGGLNEKPWLDEGLCVSDVPYEDFWPYPINCRSLKHALIKFHRIRLTKEEVKLRINRGIWDKDAGEALLLGGPKSAEPVRQAKAQAASVQLTPDVDRPYNAVEAWFDYELLPGKIYKLVCVFAPELPKIAACLRLYYQYYSRPIDPFVDARIMPKEDSFYGMSMPEMLEQAQEEQAQIHNARRDANSIINVPGWKKKRYVDVPNPSVEWYPGKVFELDNMDDLEPLQFQSQYVDTTAEEAFLLQLSERYSGIGPPAQAAGQGMLEGKRGIYNTGGTLALLAEGNRRLDIYIRRLRLPFHNLGNLIYQSYRDFKPSGAEYTMWGATGEAITKSFEFKEPEGYRGLFFEIAASDGSANKEIDRTNLLLMANTMSAYYRQIVEAGAMLAQLPPDHPMAQILLMVLDGAKDLANRLLFAFDIGDRERVLPDIRKLLAGGDQEAAATAERAGLPPVEEPLSVTGLQDLSRNLAAITSATRRGNGGV